jgi:hypothetical protein
MAAHDLPDKDSPDIHLVVGTPDENHAQTIANSSEWRGALSLEAYLRREEVLLSQTLTKDGGLTPWMLVYQPPNGGQRQVLCGCESIKKKALVARGGKVQDVVTHGVASVFCPESKRKKGYAGRMMSELGPRLRTWDVKDEEQSAFSVLYSDIGKRFYAARGWQVFPSSHIALPVVSESKSDLLACRKLQDVNEMEELCAADEQILRRRLEKHVEENNKPAVALIPDAATLTWHHARQDFVATYLNNGQRPSFLDEGGNGAMVEISSGKRVWCYWTRVWTNPQEESPDTLHILRLAIEDQDFSDFDPASEQGVEKVRESPNVNAVAALLARAQYVAHQSGMKQVEIWNPTSTTLAAARKIYGAADVVHREKESITSLQWYGEGDWRDVEWVCNEKYGWC